MDAAASALPEILKPRQRRGLVIIFCPLHKAAALFMDAAAFVACPEIVLVQVEAQQ